MTLSRTARRATPLARRALLLLVLLVGLVAVAPASPASAHAFLESSSPSDGAVLEAAPVDLQLHFSESVLLAATAIDVVDADGHHYAPQRLVRAGNGPDGLSVVATLPHLPRNAYRVSWETLASEDLHRTSGVLVFGIAAPVTAAGWVEPRPSPDEALLRWLVFVSLALALGGGFAARLFRRQEGVVAAGVAQHCERWSAVGAGAGTVIAAALLLDQLASGGWAGAQLLTSAYGQHWLLREAGFLVLLGVAAAGRRSSGSRLATLLYGAGAVAVSSGTALLGHSAAGRGLALTRVAADAAHLGAAGVWAGTLLVLGLVAVPLLRAGGNRAAAGRTALRAFGLPAAGCVAIMTVTGLYLASGVVGSVDAALVTFYGRALLLKLALVAVAGGFGLHHVVRLHRRSAGAPPRRTILAEAAAALAILALAAVLTSAQPALEPQFIRTQQVSTVPVVDGQAADLQETLAIRPNRPGRNVALVGVFDTRRPAPGPVNAVDITFLHVDGGQSAPMAAARLADGQWSLPLQISSPGQSLVRISVRRAGFPDAVHTYEWNVGTAPAATRPVTVSNAPIAAALRAMAGVLAVLLLCAWATVAWRRRRRRAAAPSAEEPVKVDALAG